MICLEPVTGSRCPESLRWRVCWEMSRGKESRNVICLAKEIGFWCEGNGELLKGFKWGIKWTVWHFINKKITLEYIIWRMELVWCILLYMCKFLQSRYIKINLLRYSILNLLDNAHTIFQSGPSNLHCQQCVRASAALWPDRHEFFFQSWWVQNDISL